MRIKRSYTDKWKIGMWTAIGLGIYQYFYPETFRYYNSHFFDLHAWQPDYENFKRRAEHRWSQYLRFWDPYDYGSGMQQNGLGYLSNSIFDKLIYGEARFEDPASYDRSADEFIQLAVQSGLDPAQPLLDNITKVVNAYYPEDLDEQPDQTKAVLKPEIKWTYETTFDEYIEENEKKPKPNTLARYLWFVPGYQEYFNWIKSEAQNEEETKLLSLQRDDRQIFYETIDELTQRWGLELNDYAPLLAQRWDRKLKLATFLMKKDESHQEMIHDLLMQPGGVKKIFSAAGIISPDEDDYQNTN